MTEKNEIRKKWILDYINKEESVSLCQSSNMILEFSEVFNLKLSSTYSTLRKLLNELEDKCMILSHIDTINVSPYTGGEVYRETKIWRKKTFI